MPCLVSILRLLWCCVQTCLCAKVLPQTWWIFWRIHSVSVIFLFLITEYRKYFASPQYPWNGCIYQRVDFIIHKHIFISIYEKKNYGTFCYMYWYIQYRYSAICIWYLDLVLLILYWIGSCLPEAWVMFSSAREGERKILVVTSLWDVIFKVFFIVQDIPMC